MAEGEKRGTRRQKLKEKSEHRRETEKRRTLWGGIEKEGFYANPVVNASRIYSIYIIFYTLFDCSLKKFPVSPFCQLLQETTP